MNFDIDDIAAKREARRRRILDNSENRLKKITGKYEKNPAADNLQNYSNSCTEESVEFPNSSEQYQHSKPAEYRCSSEEDTNKYDNSDSSPTESSIQQRTLQQITCEQSRYALISSLLFSPLACILLAAFVNIIVITRAYCGFFKGIVTPYIIVATIQLSLADKSQAPQGSNAMMTALILSNIKPAIAHNLKKLLTIFSILFKDFALYLACFALFQWVISIYLSDSNLQFF